MFGVSLVNDPFDDPAVYLELKHRRRAMLFDLGDIRSLPARKILKIDYVFISHTHMDHFIGFDQLVRICLGRDRHITLFGPPGFTDQVERRLGAYCWNLVEHYENDFILQVEEVHPDGRVRTAAFNCRQGFRREDGAEQCRPEGLLVEEQLFTVHGTFLDHRIPCLAFRFEEKQHINIKKNVLLEMGFTTGPWLNELKDLIARGTPGEYPVRALMREGDKGAREVSCPLGILRERAVKITPGRRVAYVTDCLYSDANEERIVALAAGADVLFIETVFLDEDRDRAAATFHLTARQAGELACRAGVKRFIPFHFSPKYKGRGELLHHEAMASFTGKEN
ncbi:MAG: MBL fold metallo-hydrolase [Syntrophales bacterium]|nr:MBL fold metallo-hydrolase [Syntrophales bacterium]